MSRSVDLFVASDQPSAAVAAHIAERGGLEVAAVGPDGERFELAGDGLTAVLHHHEYLDDDGLPLSRYAYALSLRTQASGHLGTTREVTFLRRVSTALDHLPVLLVLDLQNRDTAHLAPAANPAPPPGPSPAPGLPSASGLPSAPDLPPASPHPAPAAPVSAPDDAHPTAGEQ
jgi:hypothetical protein